MELKDYLASLPDEQARRDFAVECGTTLGHMRNCIYSPADERKYLSAVAAVAVNRESVGVVGRWGCRPHDWHLIWPELIATEGAPAVTVEAI